VFTAGGTEADNLAIRGAAWAASARGRHLVTTTVEHQAVLGAFAQLERFGFTVTYLDVDRYGRADPDLVAASLTPHTTLVSIGYANGEIGTASYRRDRRDLPPGRCCSIPMPSGAAHLDLDVDSLQVDLLVLHPQVEAQGAGALLSVGTASSPAAGWIVNGVGQTGRHPSLTGRLRLAQAGAALRDAEHARQRGLWQRCSPAGHARRR
jgi:cysteine desulfurase